MTIPETISGDENLLNPNSTETVSLRSAFGRPDDLAYLRANRKQPVSADIFARYYGRTSREPEMDERIVAEMSIIDARLRGATDANLESLGILDAPELTPEQNQVLQDYETARRETLHQQEVEELRRLGVLSNSVVVTLQLSFE